MLTLYKKLFNKKELLTGNFSLEREALIVASNGSIFSKNYTEISDDKTKNPYIIKPLSKNQVEITTPRFSTLDDSRDFLESLYDIVCSSIDEDYIWPQSMPHSILETSSYDTENSLVSGLHYKFSFKEGFIKKLYESTGEKKSYKKFKNDFYLKITRNDIRYKWFLTYILSGEVSLNELNKDLEEGVIPFKSNKQEISYPNYNSVESYVKSIINFMSGDLTEDYTQLYTQVKLKSKDKNNIIDSLLKNGIEGIEIRNIDINPFEKIGISLEDLKFIHLFLLYASVKEESSFENWQEEALYNQRAVSGNIMKNVELKIDGKFISKKDFAFNILSEIENLNSDLLLGFEENIKRVREKFENPLLTYSHKITEKVINEGILNASMSLSKEYKESAYRNRFKMIGYEDMELSTQILIKESIKRGIFVEMLDRQENFISLTKGNKKEFVRKATETSLDSYATVLVMENKVTTKKVLRKNGIKVPNGYEFDSIEDAEGYIEELVNTPVVVKPKSTNFGIGISIFPNGTNKHDLKKAFEIAFENDSTVLVEEFIKGKEFRFLVIGDEVAGVLNRVPANVVGNGKDNIEKLVEEKNKSYLRGKGYKTPLEKIKLDKHVDLFLSQRGLNTEYVPQENEVVYLRENSNISTGGDSVDYTDEMPKRFKDIAVASAKAVNATICGVDLMVENFENELSPYSIIELNFNPAIHIHSFPYKGKERKIAEKVLKVLGFIG